MALTNYSKHITDTQLAQATFNLATNEVAIQFSDNVVAEHTNSYGTYKISVGLRVAGEIKWFSAITHNEEFFELVKVVRERGLFEQVAESYPDYGSASSVMLSAFELCVTEDALQDFIDSLLEDAA